MDHSHTILKIILFKYFQFPHQFQKLTEFDTFKKNTPVIVPIFDMNPLVFPLYFIIAVYTDSHLFYHAKFAKHTILGHHFCFTLRTTVLHHC